MSDSFFKTMRSSVGMELLKDAPAYLLLSQIAYRARWTDSFNKDGLSIGQALIGDYKNIGLTEKQYRNAKKRLERGGFVTFKRAFNGTVATLINNEVFDLNISNGANTSSEKGRSKGDQGASNYKEKKDKNVLFDQFYKNYPKHVSKKAAEKKFLALDNDTQLKCIAAAKVYAEECKLLGTDPKFIKHPSTWLSQGCWEDETTYQLTIDCPYSPDDIRRFKALHASGAGLPSDFDQQYKHLITG
ncbi:MAG TPA: hypothetical protein VFM99_01180 [Chitinophagales bacterium]|nr:hypothetical protein [Chitinophagales bacterium]